MTNTEAPPPTESTSPLRSAVRPWDYWALWVIALTSLALNLWLINTLMGVRRQVGEAAGTAAESVSQLRGSTFEYTVHIRETVPIAVNVPINETLEIPIDTTIPVSTVVQVPIEIPLIGFRTLSIPIRATIPVKLEPQIPISLTVPIVAEIPVSLDAPVRIVVADTPLDDSLNDAETYLENLSAELGVNPTPTATPTQRPRPSPTRTKQP